MSYVTGFKFFAAALLFGLASLVCVPARAQAPVGVALILLVDVSGSVDDNEYEMQRTGIANAFRDPQVVRAISSQPHSTIAATVVMWSDGQMVVVPWQLIDGEGAAADFAARIASVRRPYSAGTHLGDALAFAFALMPSCPCRADRQVIDVSGDGRSNGGATDVATARTAAITAGIVINGLPITGSEAGVTDYYRDEVVADSGGFIVEAQGFADFARAMRAKLSMEIASLYP